LSAPCRHVRASCLPVSNESIPPMPRESPVSRSPAFIRLDFQRVGLTEQTFQQRLARPSHIETRAQRLVLIQPTQSQETHHA
jgi:hypothetical protein